jgi:3-hydroxyacyl-[acyl-carrier-protein] dehydratase
MFEEHLDSLPHGREFRFVDVIDILVHGKSAVGRYFVRGDENFFLGHFPGMPIMPGVILVEAVAQLAGIIIQSDPDQPRLDDLRLCSIRNVKISGTAIPGDELLISAGEITRFDNLVQARGEVKVSGKTVISAVIALSGNA